MENKRGISNRRNSQKAEQYVRRLVKNPLIFIMSFMSTSLFLKVNILQKSLSVL